MLSDVQAKLVAAQNCHPNAVQALIAEALDALDDSVRAEAAVKAEREGQESVAWLWQRNCANGGYTREVVQFESQARELAADSKNLKQPDIVLPLYTTPPAAVVEQASAAVPDGMVLVPVKATAEMSYAADLAIMERGYIRGGGADRVWAAMLAASQPEVN